MAIASARTPGRGMRPFLVFLYIINISATPPIPHYPLYAVPFSRRKTVVATQIEIIHFIEHYNHSAMLTLRFPSGTRLKKAQQCYNNAARRFLKELFPAWIAVVEFDDYDRPHFHLVVHTRQDFRTGFNFDAYHAMRDITKRAYDEYRALTKLEKIKRGDYSRNLTTNPALKALWKHLRTKLPGFGFGARIPAELIPIEKNGQAIAYYLTKQFLSEQFLGRIPKGARLLRVSTGYPRVIPSISKLVIDTPGRDKYLERRERIRQLLGGLTHAQMKISFGPHWAWRCGQVGMRLDDQYGKQPIPWSAPEVLALIEEVMSFGYVRPDPVDELDYLLVGHWDKAEAEGQPQPTSQPWAAE